MDKFANAIFSTLTTTFLSIYFFSAPAAASPDIFSLFPIEHYDQNISNWISPTDSNYTKPLLTPKQQQIRKAELYFHYFGKQSPWNEDFIRLIFSQQAPMDLRT